MPKIYIDAGHGGKDSGATGNGLLEKDVVLNLTEKIQENLKKYQDVEIIVSRETDIFLSLDERTDKANAAKADLLISVHNNASDNAAARGIDTFIYPYANSATKAFQNVMHQEIIESVREYNIKNRGKKQANFHMLRQSKMPAILVENLFVSNAADAALLKTDSFLEKLATGYTNGLEKYLGLKRIEKPPQRIPEKLYYVQVGAFEEKKNAEALAADLQKEGYRPMIKYQ